MNNCRDHYYHAFSCRYKTPRFWWGNFPVHDKELPESDKFPWYVLSNPLGMNLRPRWFSTPFSPKVEQYLSAGRWKLISLWDLKCGGSESETEVPDIWGIPVGWSDDLVTYITPHWGQSEVIDHHTTLSPGRFLKIVRGNEPVMRDVSSIWTWPVVQDLHNLPGACRHNLHTQQ